VATPSVVVADPVVVDPHQQVVPERARLLQDTGVPCKRRQDVVIE
jgi:hypothetical protein